MSPIKNVLYFQIYNECNKKLIKKCHVQCFFRKSLIKVGWFYRFVGDYFDQKHISDFHGHFIGALGC